MSNKITINRMDSICQKKDPVTLVYATDDGEIKLEFTTALSLAEEQILIDRVVDTVVSENDYYPGMYDAVFFAIFLQMCSNISVPIIEKDSNALDIDEEIFDMEKINKWINESTIFNDLLNNKITGSYIKGLLSKINRKIDFKLQQLSNKSPLSDFIKSINHLIESGDFPDILAGMLNGDNSQNPQVITGGANNN